jgi:hypothetical protein
MSVVTFRKPQLKLTVSNGPEAMKMEPSTVDLTTAHVQSME